MAPWFNGMERMKELILDPSVDKMVCRFGDIHVRVETEAFEKLMRLDFSVLAVRLGNLFVLSNPHEPPLPEEMRAEHVEPVETLPISERDVEVFYLGGDDPRNHGIGVRYRTVQVMDTVFEVVPEDTGYGPFLRCVLFVGSSGWKEESGVDFSRRMDHEKEDWDLVAPGCFGHRLCRQAGS
ncbi:MAG: hypothetical protein H5U10_17255 [Desulfacinum sp.]|nr:hypothetical protein [Desulfacinum sp.]MBZ4660747.1 hypothetical protein [Desulfacinum sp.]